ncbi:MAG: preprotein translocase subunit SecE [Thermoleophilaceae bacterium]|nr:preprotein translocase subunit SecE [Thermoleophilaceae bacterium]MEA2399416.1 preprotein translocase subunit SecE [Thermoleophilaceae bacterium]
MARDRQRAKQRQAERREARIAARRAGASPGAPEDVDAAQPLDEDDPRDGQLGAQAGPIAGTTGAPPQNVGRSDTVAESPPPAPILDGELEGDELDDDGAPDEIYEDELDPEAGDGGGQPPVRGPRGVRGGGGGDGEPGGLARSSGTPARPARRGGGKVLGFLIACWAELQRVQWPDRRTLTQLTGIVLFFVIIAGAYLGALDAVFSKLIQAIL